LHLSLHRFARLPPEIYDAITPIPRDELRQRTVPDDPKRVVDVLPRPKKDVDAFLLIQPAYEQAAVSPQAAEGRGPLSTIRLNGNSFGWESAYGKRLLSAVRQGDKTVYLAFPGSGQFVELNHRGESQCRTG
jgi:hypothetical protein